MLLGIHAQLILVFDFFFFNSNLIITRLHGKKKIYKFWLNVTETVTTFYNNNIVSTVQSIPNEGTLIKQKIKQKKLWFNEPQLCPLKKINLLIENALVWWINSMSMVYNSDVIMYIYREYTIIVPPIHHHHHQKFLNF